MYVIKPTCMNTAQLQTQCLLKPVHTTTMLIPYEHRNHHNGKLIPEQYSGEPNPLLQLAVDTSLMSRT
jgi:hypothetical protein